MGAARTGAVALAGAAASAGAVVSVALGRGEPGHTGRLAILVVITTYAVVAAVILVARPRTTIGRLMMAGALAWGVGEALLAIGVEGAVTEPGSIPGAATVGVVGTAVRAAGWLVLALLVPLLFPDGRTAWPGHRLPVLLAVAAIAAFSLAALVNPVPLESRLSSVPNPLGLPASMQLVADAVAVTALVSAAGVLVLAVVGVVHRWRGGDELVHQQLLWFALAFCLPLVTIPVAATPWARPWMFAAASLPTPVAIGVALLQRRLYDIQLVVSRTLTYVLLSMAVAGLHALTVAGVGAFLRDSDAVWLPWAAAGVVAAAFLPLRDALQGAVTRLTYGQWSQPAAVLAASGRRLADASDVPALLDSLVAEIGAGLRMQRVEIVDERGRSLARHGDPVGAEDDVLVPLLAYGVPVGVLRHTARGLRPADRTLLADVARQLGGVVHSAALLDTIREGQERVVRAREEERRRLRRDLHDGLGPTLAALTLQVDTLRNRLVPTLPVAAGGGAPAATPASEASPVAGALLERELLRLRSGIQATVHDVRRIVEGLRPPALDEDGLDGALRRLADDVTAGSDLALDLDLDAVERVPAAVEVATYRVAQEALTNVVRHSGAGHASVRLSVDDDSVTLVVCDDGCGPGPGRVGGLGLVSMRERAEEIGGTVVVDGGTHQGRGTRVVLRLPLAATTEGVPG
ncbi:MAG TPA: ATP-binding protein [Ornithinibacter sp.]|nr:ATP-binding protein [Ornithinibacter sp.]